MDEIHIQKYIMELRKKLIVGLILFVGGCTVGAVYYKQLLVLALTAFNLKGVNLVVTQPYQFIDLAISIGLFAGVSLAFPFLTYQFFLFIKPALRPQEQTLFGRLLPLSIVLLVIGFLFGVFIMQFVVALFSQGSSALGVNNILDISDFLTQIILMGIATGIVFQLPIFLTVVMRLGIISRKSLVNKRKHVHAGLIIFAALLPPTDVFSLVLLCVPLMLLFEGTLLFNRGVKV